MTDIGDRYSELRGLARADVAGRVREWFPDGVQVQWWGALLERVESRVSPLCGAPPEERAADFALGAALVTVVPGPDGPSRVRAGHRALRLAALALRPGQEGVALPEELTPDGAVRLALDSLPWTPDEALREDARRRAADGPHMPGEPVVGRAPDALDELRWTLPALEWVLPRVSEAALREHARVWLREVLPRLGQES